MTQEINLNSDLYYKGFLLLKKAYYEVFNVEKLLKTLPKLQVREDICSMYALEYIEKYVLFEKTKEYFLNEILKLDLLKIKKWSVNFEREVFIVEYNI